MGIIDLLFPKSCLGCGSPNSYICASCIQKVKLPRAICPTCLRFSLDGKTHIKCLTPQGLNGLISLWNYDGVVRKAILALKFKFAKEIATELSDLAARRIPSRTFFPNDSVLIPIPIYWLRRNWRGFNQSEEIGKRIALKAGWKFTSDLLIRKERSVPQTELKRKERLENVRGVFSLNPGYKQTFTNYILFDDVWTTGSTLKAACKVLKRSGVEKVWGFTLAKG